MKKLLVTGASGFIGRHVLPLVAARDYEVYAVSPIHVPVECPGVTTVYTDLLNFAEAGNLIRRVRPTHLMHFAWYSSPGKYWTSPENLSWVQASIELLRSFAENGGQRAVFAGSCAEYDWSYGYCSETKTPLRPSTLYGVCKHALQQIVDAFCVQTGLSYGWGRIFFVYGPNEYPQRLVSGAIAALLKGQNFVCSHGTLVRDYLHVQDVAAAFVALLESGVQGPVNIGSGTPVTIKEVVATIGRKLNRYDLIEWGAAPLASSEPRLVVADVNRLSNEVEWKPEHSLDSGLNETIAWWKQQISEAEA